MILMPIGHPFGDYTVTRRIDDGLITFMSKYELVCRKCGHTHERTGKALATCAPHGAIATCPVCKAKKRQSTAGKGPLKRLPGIAVGDVIGGAEVLSITPGDSRTRRTVCRCPCGETMDRALVSLVHARVRGGQPRCDRCASAAATPT